MSEQDESTASAAKRAEVVKQQYTPELMTKANVVGVGIGYRVVAGETTGEVALVVMVSEKIPDAQLEPQDRIPREIDGVPVDVQETGAFRAY